MPPLVQHDTNKMSHGVTQLTYVGDDEALETVASPVASKTIGMVGLAAVAFGSGFARLVGAAMIGYAYGKLR